MYCGFVCLDGCFRLLLAGYGLVFVNSVGHGRHHSLFVSYCFGCFWVVLWLCLLIGCFSVCGLLWFGFGFGCRLYLSGLCVVCFGLLVVGYLIHAYDLWLVVMVVICLV